MIAQNKGLTLIEVLLALAVLAIALTAMLKITAQNISGMSRLKDKTISYWVAENGARMVQSGLLPVVLNREITQKTTMAGQTWYWRVLVQKTPIKHVEKISIKLSQNSAGPFQDALTAFRFAP